MAEGQAPAVQAGHAPGLCQAAQQPGMDRSGHSMTAGASSKLCHSAPGRRTRHTCRRMRKTSDGWSATC